MDINRNSWHYKVRVFGCDYGEPENDSLCIYFWAIVIRLCMLGFITVVLGAAIHGYCTHPHVIPITIEILSFIGCIILPVLGVMGYRKYIDIDIDNRTRIPGENLVIEYVKARKRKICPLIEYKG